MSSPLRLVRTDQFEEWLDGLADRSAAAIIIARLLRLEQGLRGDVRSVGGRVSELRIAHGPGYRVYYTQRGRDVVILLCGGDKSSQVRDISTAQAFAIEVPHGH